jgi:hypothetical protein
MDGPKRTSRLRRLERNGTELPLGNDARSIRRRIEALERMLEGMIEIPVLRRRFGLDAIVGVIPVVGDVMTAALGLYLVWEARNLGLSRWQLWRMLASVGFDTAVGAVPLAGDLFDLLYRSNSRNLRVIRKHLDRHYPVDRIING